MAIKYTELVERIAADGKPGADILDKSIDEFVGMLQGLAADGSFEYELKATEPNITKSVLAELRARYGGPDGWNITFDPEEPRRLEFVPSSAMPTGRLDR